LAAAAFSAHAKLNVPFPSTSSFNYLCQLPPVVREETRGEAFKHFWDKKNGIMITHPISPASAAPSANRRLLHAIWQNRFLYLEIEDGNRTNQKRRVVPFSFRLGHTKPPCCKDARERINVSISIMGCGES
jgi:hypothetical protein